MIKKSFYFDGKRYYITAPTELEAVERMAVRKAELEEGRERITRTTICSDWFRMWLLTYKKPSVSDGWFTNVKSIVESIIIPQIGNYRLKDIRPIHLQRILNSRADNSQSYIRLIYVVIADAFKTARKNGLILSDPSEAVTIPKGRQPDKRRALTPKERHFVLLTCEKHRAGLFYLIMLYCGLRPGEVAALQWRCVDLKSRVLNVDSALKPDGSIGQPTSSAGIRKVPIPGELATRLESEPKHTPFDFVCTNAHGGQLKPSAVRQQWKSFTHQLNIEMGCQTFRGELLPPFPVADDLVPYCLRHTYCTDLQAAGVPLNVARELMGHADISVTSKIYTHSSDEAFNDAAETIEKLSERRKNDEKKGIVENF